jgi:hypothetical protein
MSPDISMASPVANTLSSSPRFCPSPRMAETPTAGFTRARACDTGLRAPYFMT